jgi:hypothetical protein
LPWPVSYGTVTPMESEPGSSASDAAEESDSERRRRRRRRKKRKGKQATAETQRLFLLARWAVGGLTMLAAWGCGIYVYDTTGSFWGGMLYFPAGIAAMICVSYALAVPFVTMLAMIVGFLLRIDSGLLIGLQRAGMAFLAIGALNGVWRIFVFFMTKREVTRNEAGYK